MGDIPLSADTKIKRAKHHLDELNREIEAWLNPTPYKISSRDNHDGKARTFRIEVTPTDRPIGGLLGDTICCLRSSLDHLAWALAHLPMAPKLTRKQEKLVNFPIAAFDDAR